MIVELLIINFILCFIIEYSGFVDTFKIKIYKIFFKKELDNPRSISIKPFDCCLCMSFWCTLAYLIIFHKMFFLYIIGYSCANSLLTMFTAPFFRNLDYNYAKIIKYFNKK